jgi:hypothetical protein
MAYAGIGWLGVARRRTSIHHDRRSSYVTNEHEVERGRRRQLDELSYILLFHADGDGIATKTKHQTFALCLEVQDHACTVLQPQIPTAAIT